MHQPHTDDELQRLQRELELQDESLQRLATMAAETDGQFAFDIGVLERLDALTEAHFVQQLAPTGIRA
jgi:hypothetical protein